MAMWINAETQGNTQLFVYGFTIGEHRMVMAAPDIESARQMAFDHGSQDNVPIFEMNHCGLDWRDQVMATYQQGNVIH